MQNKPVLIALPKQWRKMTNQVKAFYLCFLSVLATDIPAYAVDYVACREMLKARNDVTLNALRIENDYKNNPPTLREDKNNICYKKSLGMLREQPNNNENQSLEEKSKKYQDVLDKCRETVKYNYILNLKPRHYLGGKPFYTDEGYAMTLWSIKIRKDMLKAGCPPL